MDFSGFLLMRDEISLVALILILLLYDLFAPAKARKAFQPVACLLFVVQIAITLLPTAADHAFGGMYVNTPVASVVKTLMSAGTLLVFLFSKKWLEEKHEIAQGEFYFLTLSTLLGMYFMVSSGHFLMFYLGIELASIPLACLVAFSKKDIFSAEAGAKFILNASFASGVSLFGMSLLYGGTGTLYFSDMPIALTGTPLQIAGMILFATGLFFKMSLIPYHSWTADVYQGAPTQVSAYLSVVSKTAAAVTLFTIFFKVFGDPTRLRLLILLDSRGEMGVGAIAEELSMSQSAISQQLKVLRSSRLVKYRKDGRSTIYRLSDDHIHRILSLGIEHYEELL